MKKITLIFAALALAFSVSAANFTVDNEYGGEHEGVPSLMWSLETNSWDMLVDPDGINVCAPVTIAVEVANPDIINWLDEDQDNRFVAWSPFYYFPNLGGGTGFDWRSVGFDSRWGARFTRVDGTNIWHITFTPSMLFTNQVMNNEQRPAGAVTGYDWWPSGPAWWDVIEVVGNSGEHFFAVPGDDDTRIVNDGVLRMHGELFTVGFTGEVTLDALGRETREVVYGPGDWSHTGVTGVTGPFPMSAEFQAPFFVIAGNCVTSIADVIAAERDLTPVAFYSLLGQRLQREPSSGIFIVRFCDGSTMKIAK